MSEKHHAGGRRPQASLPIDAVRAEIVASLGTTPIVLSAPTGSGKSTQVPRYCPGRTLVVEPRRVACRGLAMRVAELEGCELGSAVGYRVRDDDRSSAATRILFATPGIVLRMFSKLQAFDHIILDEFHERGLETDLLLALLAERFRPRLVVMSATLDAARLTDHLGAAHVHAEGRLYPIDIRYRGERAQRPEPRDLAERVCAAVADASMETEPAASDNDILVFLPGKAEIARVEQALRARQPKLTVLPLHGGLSLSAQARALARAGKRKVIVTTNVAETSLTVPGVGVVIDSGLVRRTRYHQGRSYLALNAISQDSATQRAGRAGRTGPGLCIRLWGQAAQLEAKAAPEIHRESLVTMVLAARMCEAVPEQLPFVDPPKEHALSDANQELLALGAVDARGAVTATGKALFGLPLDPGLGRLLIQAQHASCRDDALDLVAALSSGVPLFEGPDPDDDPLEAGQCDVTRLINGLRGVAERADGSSQRGVQEARRQAQRLRAAFGLATELPNTPFVGRRALALTAMRADPRCAHVVRRRGQRLALSNGGTELEVGRESLMGRGVPKEAALVLGTHGIYDTQVRTRLLATCVMPIEPEWMIAAGLGQDRLRGCRVEGDRLVATIETVFAKRVLAHREAIPKGELAQTGLAKLIVDGGRWKRQRDAIELALEQAHLAIRLKERMRSSHIDTDPLQPPADNLEAWLSQRLSELGFEDGEDLPLVSPEDLAPPPLPQPVQAFIDDNFPLRVDLGDAAYRVEYDLKKRRAIMHMVRGNRQKPPARNYLPRFPGLQVFVETSGGLSRVT